MEAQLFEALCECEFGRHLDVRIGVGRLRSRQLEFNVGVGIGV